MRFQVPQFIERETRIAGPLTFKQFVLMAIAAGFVGLLYLALAKKSFFLMILLSATLVIGAFALAFVKVGGRPLPTVLGNLFGFLVETKVFLWKKKALPPRIIWKQPDKKSGIAKPKSLIPELKIIGKSRLKDIGTAIDTAK
jgi:hypothetical protein